MHRLALGGVVGPVILVVVIVVCGALRPDYSHLHQFISELGATGTTHAAVMNYPGFVLAGLLIIGFGVALLRGLPSRPMATIGAALTLVFGLGVVGSGLLSCDPGCPQAGGSTENFLHDKIAPLGFLALITATWLLGVVFRRLAEWRALSLYSIATGVVALAFLLGIGSTLETRVYTGLWQRLLVATLFAWTTVIGWRLFCLGRRKGEA